MLGMRTMLTTVATITAITTVTTLRTTITTLTTIATLATLRALTALTTGRTLYVVGRLLDQHTVRELVLTLGSISSSFTLILSPSLIPASSTVSRRFQSISEIWSRPSLPGMISTKQP